MPHQSCFARHAPYKSTPGDVALGVLLGHLLWWWILWLLVHAGCLLWCLQRWLFCDRLGIWSRKVCYNVIQYLCSCSVHHSECLKIGFTSVYMSTKVEIKKLSSITFLQIKDASFSNNFQCIFYSRPSFLWIMNKLR